MKNLVDRLLQIKPAKRPTARQAMEHAFFADIDWQRIRSVTPPFIPTLSDDYDTSYFSNRGLQDLHMLDGEEDIEGAAATISSPNSFDARMTASKAHLRAALHEFDESVSLSMRSELDAIQEGRKSENESGSVDLKKVALAFFERMGSIDDSEGLSDVGPQTSRKGDAVAQIGNFEF